MRLARLAALCGVIAFVSAGAGLPASQASPQEELPRTVVTIPLHDTLQAVSASSLVREVQRANRPGVSAIVIDLSTPGGMHEAVDTMVTAMRESRVPIIVWAGMPETRVSGEGLRLLAAADVALMGPSSYLTPLWTERPRGLRESERAAGSRDLERGLMTEQAEHGRTADIASALARGSHWFGAAEALQNGFIDGVARSQDDALRFVQGRAVRRAGVTKTIDLRGASVEKTSTNYQDVLLLTLMNPDLAVLLLTLGTLLIYLEINTPGTVVPGAAGVLLVVLAAFALHLLPLSPIGMLLCAVAVGLLLLEARYTKHGVFASVGVAALVVGLALLVRGPLPELEVSWGTALGAGVGFGGVTAILIVLAVEARRAKVKTGADALLGWLAVAQTPLAPEGRILVRGELWPARIAHDSTPVAAGERVKVLRADGPVLEVTALPVAQPA